MKPIKDDQLSEDKNSKIREAAKKNLKQVLDGVDDKLIEEIEKGNFFKDLEMFDLYKGVLDIDYKNKGISLKMNLKRNADLRERVKSGELKPKDLVIMDSKDMVTKEEREHREKVEKEAFDA